LGFVGIGVAGKEQNGGGEMTIVYSVIMRKASGQCFFFLSLPGHVAFHWD
jgi:hypothetical protein